MGFDRSARRRDRRTWTSLAWTTALGAGVLHAGAALAASAAPAAAPAAAAPSQPMVSIAADRMLRQMSAYLGGAEAFTVHADVTFDRVLPGGQKLQFTAVEDVALQRPRGLYIAYQSDLGARRFWYDGKTYTLHDPSTLFYAQAAAPADLDAALKGAVAATGFSPPLGDFLGRDPYSVLMGGVRSGTDLGLRNVGGRSCRMLAFVAKDIDWQVWIAEEPQPFPCKIVITYKTRPSQPQYAAEFTDWDFNPRFAENGFAPQLPAGAKLIPFKAVGGKKP